ncbi:hypothetical protein CEXT_427671 [Caerostris extrusa]|uniref:F-box domain-containing protein n=1 Tax=Caerostris extrusa TaxID=172846 RepID=A0AAV4Q1G1_CAEEX|nr:hypothetical protein CEXT_427671 [Caerostris extrusa]
MAKICKVLAEEEALINKKLPKELLLRIFFSYLDVISLCRCAQVSKQWNILALDGSNWQRIDLFNFQTDIEGDVVENISKRCGGFLKKLSLRGCQSVEDAALKAFAQNCNHIEELNLYDCKKLTDITCQHLSKYCSKLVHLDVGSCPQITDASLKAIGDGCPNLEHINISWCDQVSLGGVAVLAQGCRKLKVFISKGCTFNLYLKCFQSITDESLQYRSALSQAKLFVYFNCSQLTDSSLIALWTWLS